MKKAKQLFCISFLLIINCILAQTPSLKWANVIGNANDKTAAAIAVDTSGNSYVTGHFSGTMDFDPGAGVFNMTAKGGFDLFAYKLDHAGNFVWAVQLSSDTSTASVQGKAIAVNPSGQVFITGSFQRTVDFDPGAGVSSVICAGVADVFVLKLDTNGKFIFVKTMGGTSTDVAYAIHVDKSGNIYTTGNFMGTSDFDPGAATFNLINNSASVDIFISKLDASGNFLWAKGIGGSNTDMGYSVTTDVFGNVYVAGDFSSTVDFDPGAATFNLTSAGSSDVFVSKFSSAGNFLWAGRMGGVSVDSGRSIAVDASGNAYITGTYVGDGSEDYDPGSGVFKLPSVNSTMDAFIVKLTTSGTFAWAKSMGGTAIDYGISIALDTSENICLAGFFRNTTDFDPGAGVFNMTSAGGADIFALKLDNAGNFIYAGRMGGTGEDFGQSMALDRSGFPSITGVFQKTVDFDPTAGVLNYTAVQGSYYDIFTLKLGAIPSVVLTTTATSICSGKSITLKVTGGVTPSPYTYLWSPSGSISNTTFQSVTATPDVTTTYTCIVTDSKGATNIGTVKITVTASPVITATQNIQTICSGSQTSIGLSSSVPGTTYSWVPTVISGNVTGASSGTGFNIVQVLSGAGIVDYKVTGYGGNCYSEPIIIHVTVKPTVTVSNQPINTFACKGDNALFTVIASHVKTYQWQVDTGSGFINLTETSPYSNTQTASLTITGVTDQLTTYQYKVFMTDSCGNPFYSNSVKLSTTDTIKPVFTSCPLNDTIPAGVYNYTSPQATDNCTKNLTITRTAGLASGALFPIGNTLQTFESIDEAGNKSQCSFVITATTPTAIYSVTDANTIRVYPNPVSDQMKISFAKLPLNNFSITLNDITGKTILKQHFPASANDLSFNLKDVAKGIYVLHISNNDFEKVTKIIVE